MLDFDAMVTIFDTLSPVVIHAINVGVTALASLLTVTNEAFLIIISVAMSSTNNVVTGKFSAMIADPGPVTSPTPIVLVIVVLNTVAALLVVIWLVVVDATMTLAAESAVPVYVNVFSTPITASVVAISSNFETSLINNGAVVQVVTVIVALDVVVVAKYAIKAALSLAVIIEMVLMVVGTSVF